jgi:urease accessory protein
MMIAREVLPAGAWSDPNPADRVVLGHDLRHRRRRMLVAVSGNPVLLDLPQPTVLRHGDGLRLEDGRMILVEAEVEPLAEISAPDIAAIVRIAWHLGNRHLQTQLFGDRLRIRRDHVIEAMVEKLGATVTAIEAPFDPEGGAYGDHSHAASPTHTGGTGGAGVQGQARPEPG